MTGALEMHGPVRIPLTALTLPRINRVNVTAAMSAVVKEPSRRLVKTITQDHYRHTLGQIQAVLDRGAASGVATGASRVNYRKQRGGRGYVPVSWNALSTKYRRSWPRSKVFWKKRLNLSLDSRPLRMLFRDATHGKHHVTVVGTGTKMRQDWGLELSVQASFQRLPWPLNRIISQSFAEGKPRRIFASRKRLGQILKGNRNNVRIIAFPESARPFVAEMSARLGRDLHKKLLNLTALKP